MTDLIIPAENGTAAGNVKPGAVQAEAAAWIDTLLDVNGELKARYTMGLAWLDAAMKARGATDFVSASATQQTEVLDLIAYQRNRSTELTPGIDFFILARRMTADGFYTSPIGMQRRIPRQQTPGGVHGAGRRDGTRAHPKPAEVGPRGRDAKTRPQPSVRITAGPPDSSRTPDTDCPATTTTR